ncbi:MAG: hypothetical protein Q8R92_16945 [Deltaproteobacteria bacterium]|nr:hypothetical protein [Deltaproteobacteria bacterium]
MPKVSPIQTSFNSGEWSPLMYGRVDLDAYRTALATCLNLIPTVQGPIIRRPGTYFAAEVKDSAKATRLVRFEFSIAQAYVLEFGDLYTRFFTNNTQITQGGAAYEISTPYLEADIFELNHVQSADVLYIAHKDYTNRKLSRHKVATLASTISSAVTVAIGEIEVAYDSLTIAPGGSLTVNGEVQVVNTHTWTLDTLSFLDGPYLPVNAEDTTLTLGGTTGSVSVTASSTVGINGGDGFLLTDIGRLIRWKDGANNWTWLTITGYTSTTVVTATISGPDASATTATANWRLGLWSDTTGYPSTVVFYEDRLCWGGTRDYPQRIDMSKTGDYENMAPTAADGTVTDDNAVSITLNSNDVQYIRWMTNDEKGLMVGTSSSEWIVRPSTQSEALSPTNVAAKESTFHGSAAVSPVKAGKATLFVQRSGRKLRELAYVYELDGFRSPDMTLLAEHVTQGGIKEMAYQQDPHSILWCVRNDGVLAAFTYERDQKVIGWHRHIIGGYSDAAQTADPVVESVAVIPASDGVRDEVWLVVRRYINGGSKRYVEYMTKAWDQGDEAEDAVHWDGALTYDGVTTTSLTGADHLAGETVKIWADGASQPDAVVSAGGVITLARSASVVHVGYGYNSDGKMLRPEAGAADGTAQGKLQRSHRIIFRFMDMAGIKVGANFNTTGSGKLTNLTFRQTDDATGTAVPLFTGDREVAWNGDYTTENYVCWRMDTGGPGTIVAVMPQMHTQDR